MCVPGAVLVSRDTAVSKRDKNPSPGGAYNYSMNQRAKGKSR